MRLLHVRTLRFTEFREKPPTYAILSHRWSESEARLSDVERWRGEPLEKYAKVSGFAQYVRTYLTDVEWIWIDSCCINQDSPTELNKGVNRMFDWYRDAKVCMAYLADVEHPSADSVAFRESVWFTRGWTLQELVASTTVVFVTKTWQVIGHKGTVAHLGNNIHPGDKIEALLSEVTGIPRDVLQDFGNSHRLDASKKWLWMKGRRTQEEEDTVYAMFGIFGVTPGANYGEGKDNARLRLEEAMQRKEHGGKVIVELKGLKTANGAAFNSHEDEHSARCLEGTRVEILAQVHNWAEDPSGKRIFWLCGKAGTGKSTIARTVAHNLHDSGHLGASFFFKRGEGDRGNASRFFPTIAKQLADQILSARPAIAAALDKESSVCEQSLQQQFEKLLLEPFSASRTTRKVPQNIVIVIDALDECKREEDEAQKDVGQILRLLSKADTFGSCRLQIFVTSRPEMPVKLGFQSIDGRLHQDMMLEEAQAATVEQDIRKYFNHRFDEIRNQSQMSLIALPHDWPGLATIEVLVSLAVPLFIFAFTVSLYIEQGDHTECLETVLSQARDKSLLGLDGLYLPILQQATKRQRKADQQHAIERFKIIVGAIVLLADPLTLTSLSSLLEASQNQIASALSKLDSVLSISHDAPIRPLHLSFRDFLVGFDESGPDDFQAKEFHIDEAQTHARLAQQCLRQLERPGVLRQDLLQITKPGTRRADIDKDRITNCIPAETA